MSGGRKKSGTQAKNGKYTRQRTRTEANRIKKRERHFAKHPNDRTLVGNARI